MSPTVLRRHIHSCNRVMYDLVATSIEKAATKGKTISIRSPLKTFMVKKVSAMETRKQLLTATTLALVSMGAPLSAVKNKWFRCMQHKFAKAGVQAPRDCFGFESVKMEVSAQFRIVKEKVMSRLRGKIIHGTTDHWTSRDNRAFESICFQWIEDFNLATVNIECREYIGISKSEELVKNFMARLGAWNITSTGALNATEKQYIIGENSTALLATCTTDTESKMNKFGIILEMDHGIANVYCSDHVLQATALLILKAMILSDDGTMSKGVLAKCRAMVQLFSSSSQKQKELDKAQIELGQRKEDPVIAYRDASIPLKCVHDVIVRWWSTYSMVKRLVDLKPALQRLHAENKLKNTTDRANSPSRMFTEHEWNILDSLVELLEPWKEAQQELESEKTVTSSIVFPYLKILRTHLDNFIAAAEADEEEHDPGLPESLVEVARQMTVDFQNRWGDLKTPFCPHVVRGANRRQVRIHPSFMLAHALDPRFKNLAFIEDRDNKDALWEAILKEMVIVQEQQLQPKPHDFPADEGPTKCFDAVTGTGTSKPRSKKRVKTSTVTSDLWGRMLEETNNDSQEPNRSSKNKDACIFELEQYKASELLPVFVDGESGPKRDPHQEWWKFHHTKFPIVWLLARYYLAIPATSASSERSFSAAGRMMNPLASGSTRSDNFEEKFFLQQNMDEYIVKE